MKSRNALLLASSVAILASIGCAGLHTTSDQAAAPARASDDGFVTIFDGTSLDGWEIYLPAGRPGKPDGFYLDNGTIACKGYGYHWLRYAEPLTDCIVRLEFKVAEHTNSGVCLRSTKDGDPPFSGFEVQIEDDFGKDPDKHTTGAIYDVVTPMYNASHPAGQWNDMEITMQGSTVRVVLNGLKVIDTDFSKLTQPVGKFTFAYADLPARGYLALQDHYTPIWFRNIRLKKL